jgi:hypothetical protein
VAATQADRWAAWRSTVPLLTAIEPALSLISCGMGAPSNRYTG